MQQETEIVKPKRIQRKRAKGWKAPDGAQYVGRGSMWGNPFTIENIMGNTKTLTKAEAQAKAVEMYEQWLNGENLWWVEKDRRNSIMNRIRDLRGKDLMCWCPLDQPCHADVLLELANR